MILHLPRHDFTPTSPWFELAPDSFFNFPSYSENINLIYFIHDYFLNSHFKVSISVCSKNAVLDLSDNKCKTKTNVNAVNHVCCKGPNLR